MGEVRMTDEEIKAMYDQALSLVEVGAEYAHYKHPGIAKYRVVSVALVEDNWQPIVVYEYLNNGVRISRTIENFLSEVEVDGKMVKRFVKIDNTA